MQGGKLVLDSFVPYRLSLASNAVSDAVARRYRSRFGLSVPEWRVLAIAAEHDGVTQQAIGMQSRMDKVTVSRATLALVERKLIERSRHPADGRSQLLRLTEAGHELYADVGPRALEAEAALLTGFSAAERAQFEAMLRRIEAAAEGLD